VSPTTTAPTVRSLDDRIDDLEKQFIDFRARIESLLMLGKWATGFAAASFISVLLFLFSVTYSAGQLKERTDTTAAEVRELRMDVKKLSEEQQADRAEQKVIKVQLDQQKAQLDQQKAQLDQLSADVRAIKEAVTKGKP
jgi:cell division protein FtsX